MRIKVTAIDLDFTDSVEEITEDQKTQAVNNILQSCGLLRMKMI